MRLAGMLLLALMVFCGAAASLIAPNDPQTQFRDLQHAPPTRVHVRDVQGKWHRPFIYPLVLQSRLEQRFSIDRTRALSLQWFEEGRLVRTTSDASTPLLLFGADGYGRDIFSRVVYGSRATLALAFAAACGALAIGMLIGALSGFAGGWLDDVLTRVSEFVLVLPVIYVVLALRSVMPFVLPASTVFAMMAIILALVGWPCVARGVRAIVKLENHRDYADAARSLGASPWRVLLRHLLPASAGFLAVQVALLVPAFILAEATLSFIGLGFPETMPTWGTMLQEAADVTALAAFPWTIAPAGAIALVVLAVNLIFADSDASRVPGSAAFAPID